MTRRSVPARLCAALTAIALFVAGCAGGSMPSEPAPTRLTTSLDGYLLEPSNRIRVIVFNEQTLSGDFTLDPSGNIAFPLIGSVRAGGVTAKIVAERIEEALARGGYLRSPQVSVEVQTFRPFYVLGEVRQPGEFPYTVGLTVLGAIARAGGFDYRARRDGLVLVREVDGEQREYAANERTPLQPGDVVKVLERRF